MASNLAPHWGVIVFLTAVYIISFLLHLDQNIVNPGGASDISIMSAVGIGTFITGIGIAVAAGTVVSIFLNRWFGVAALLGIAFLATALSNTWSGFGFMVAVVTFSDFGLPDWIQFAIAVPCILLLTWSILAFLSAGLEVGKGLFGAGDT